MTEFNEVDLERLETLLTPLSQAGTTMRPDEVQGFFCALACGPDKLTIDDWLEDVLGDAPAFESADSEAEINKQFANGSINLAQRNSLIATRVGWHWEGVLHEYLTAKQHGPWQTLQGPVIHVSHDGARARDPETYLRDMALLEQAVRDDPTNTRNVFYLAQSCRDAGKIEPSLLWYQRRVDMGGWEEERWYALFQIAVLHERNQAPAATVREAYLAGRMAKRLIGSNRVRNLVWEKISLSDLLLIIY